ncbi:MAG: ATP-binding protein [Bdellovibrionota bacterium]
MIHRLFKPLKSQSFFLFGARGTGKTYLLDRYLDPKHTLKINLLDPEEQHLFSLDANELTQRLESLDKSITHIFIDEIQKVPKLLDLIHHFIETSNFKFALTGSSARKLKRGGANLLAGRAFVYYLFPLTHSELDQTFNLTEVLQWGSLPKLLELKTPEEKQMYLKTYVNTYIKEEIAEEQVVRKLDPFRKFLQIAAQMSGQIINYSKIGREVGVDTKTVQSYFKILEDTLIGTLVPPFHESIRKRQFDNPKFYFFDTGVKRALDRTLSVPLLPQTYAFGNAFEHFIINEIIRLNHYSQVDYEISYLRTYDDAEIDLIVERPGRKRALIEIKSKERVTQDDLRHILSLKEDISNSEAYCFSRDPNPKKIEGVICLPWQKGLKEIGL